MSILLHTALNKFLLRVTFYAIPVLFVLQCTAAHAGDIKFIPNAGQWASHIRARADVPGGRMWITDEGLVYLFMDGKKLHRIQHMEEPPTAIDAHAIFVRFEGGILGEMGKKGPSAEYYNFYQGNNPAMWRHGLRGYGQLLFKDVYPNIDFIIKGMGDVVKYDFIVHPGGNPSRIKLRYEGQNDLALSQGMLQVKTRFGAMQEGVPIVYRMGKKESGNTRIAASYSVEGQQVSFNLSEHDSTQAYDIDPQVIFSTFSGSVADNFGYTATYDVLGHGYSGGTVFEAGFPVTPGAYQMKFAGGVDSISEVGDVSRDAGILKYTPDGKQLVFATYLGGSHNEEPHSMIVNSNNELIVFGNTFSVNFPTTSGAFDRTHNGMADIYVARFAADGKSLIASTFIGGKNEDGLNGEMEYDAFQDEYRNRSVLAYNYGDIYRGEVIVDSNDRILVITTTHSNDFPSMNGFQKNFGGGYQDACIFRFSPDLKQLEWSSFLGGGYDDAGYGIGLNSKGEIYVCGGTDSDDFPMAGSGIYNEFQGGYMDGYIAAIAQDGSQLIYSTYLGTENDDQCHLIQVDKSDSIYIAGQTNGDWPIIGNVRYDEFAGQYIVKISPQLEVVELSTVFGSEFSFETQISPVAFLVDDCGQVYFSGWGGLTNTGFSTTDGMPVTPDAFQPETDGSDFYLAVFSHNLDELIYGSFFGGEESTEHVDGGTSRFDRRGIVYQSVCAGCGGFSDFPTTEDAWSRTNNGKRPHDPEEGGCNNALFKFDLGNTSVRFSFTVDTCARTVKFQNESLNSTTWNWDFGDGTTSTEENPVHTYAGDGIYYVTLKVNASSSCADRDTRALEITNPNSADFSWAVIDSCQGIIKFNSEVAGQGQLLWDFGDGSTMNGNPAPTHRFTKKGDYPVRFIVSYPNGCADTITQTVTIAYDFTADVFVPNIITPNGDRMNDFYTIPDLDQGCEPYKITIYNRWGQLLYREEGMGLKWDATTLKGEPVVQGVYYVIVESDHIGEYKTTLTVVR